jgi:hypothetical protein
MYEASLEASYECHPEPQRRVSLKGHRDPSLRLRTTEEGAQPELARFEQLKSGRLPDSRSLLPETQSGQVHALDRLDIERSTLLPGIRIFFM